MTRLTFRSGRRIVILCEGDTEELAVRHFIAKQWQADGFRAVGLHPVSVDGKLKHIGTKAALFLEEQDVLGVFTLVDLYGIQAVTHPGLDDLDAKVQRVRDWLRRQLQHGRSDAFHPHVSVHETEAWILAEGEALSRRLNDPHVKSDVDAESKDFEKPPSRRINELFLRAGSGSRYHKIVDGRPLFAAMQFFPVYNACRYFRDFYDSLKSVAGRQVVS